MKRFTTFLLTLVLAMVTSVAFAQDAEEPYVVKLGSAVTELEVGKQYVLQNVLTGGYIYPKNGAEENATLWSNDGTMKGMTEEEVAPYVITLEEVDADNLIFIIKNVSSDLYVSLSGNNASGGYSCLVQSADEDGCIVQFEPIDGTDNTFALMMPDDSGKALYTDDTYEYACMAMAPQGTSTVHELPAFQYKLYLLNFVPESELGPFPYEFVNTQWGTMDDARLQQLNITYNDDNTITVMANESGQDADDNPVYTNNAALGNSINGAITTEDYYTTLDQKWFIVVGSDLSTTTGDAVLWWLNGGNIGSSAIPDHVVKLSDGQVLFAWDVTKTGFDTNLKNDRNTQDGWTGFGLTPTTEDGTATFSDISFYTWEEAQEKYYPDLEDVTDIPEDAEPYKFVCTQWTTGDTTRTLEENVTYNEEDNTITVKAEYWDTQDPGYKNNIGLGNSTGRGNFSGITTSSFYTTQEQIWFVVVGTNLSTATGDSYLWFLNGVNYGTQELPIYAVEAGDDEGNVIIAWDVTKTGLDSRLQDVNNMQDGWTDFGVTPTTNDGTSVISDICFYTWAEAATKYPALAEAGGGVDGPVPYEFVNTQWVTMDVGRVPQSAISYNDGENSIAIRVEGQNNVALGNSSSQAQWTGITTNGFYVTNEQNWFVVMGEDLSAGLDDSYLWWLNGENNNTQVAPTVLVRDENGIAVVMAWDINESGIDDRMLEEENTLDGWTGFGLTSVNGETVIYDINFYTWDEAVAKYPELEENDNLQALLNTYVEDVAKVEELIADLTKQLDGGVDDSEREDALWDALEILWDAEDYYCNEDTTLPDDAAVEELKVAIKELEAAIAATETLSTSVSNIVVNTRESDAIYTLSGVRVQKAVKGVYIINGKKVLVK